MIGNAGRLGWLVCLAIGCGNGVDVSNELVTEDDPAAPRRSDAGRATPTTGAPLPAPQSDAGTGTTGIPCFGKSIDAWVCEGFEATSAPTPPLSLQISNGVVARVENRAIAGAASLRATLDPIPETGKAQIAFQKPTSAAAGLAVQVSVYVDDDAHDVGEDIVLASLSGGATRARLHFVPTLRGNVLELRTKTALGEGIHGLGPAPKNGWACIEIEMDPKSDLRVWRGAERKVSVRLDGATELTRAEVGIDWTHGANPNASKQFWFDDVVIAPRAIGCLH
jgi:hypothetical protein